jgi:hypothetical protein
MEFKEWLTQTEGIFDLFGKKQKPQSRPTPLPSKLAYHIADAINDAMRAVGKMPPQEKHAAPGTSSDPKLAQQYDSSLRQKIRDKYYGIARQMWERGDSHGIKSYFGFDIGPDEMGGRIKHFGGEEAGKGAFLQDVIADVEREAGIGPMYKPMPTAAYA